MSMRRFVLAVVVVVGVSAAASAGYARSPKDPVLRRRPADVALAKTLLLAASDLPDGFRDAGADRSSSSGSGSVNCKGVVEPDLHRLVMTADVSSHDFERTDAVSGFTQVSTEATLFESAADAQTGISWLVSLPKAKLDSCFSSMIRAGLPKTAKTAGFHLTVARRTIGQVQIFVWELQVQFERNGSWIPIDMVIAGFHRARALEMLTVVSGGRGLDPAVMTGFSRTLTARLAHAAL
jgi:hypothetical protein